MTTAVVVLAVALAGCVAGIVALSNWLKSALYDTSMAGHALTYEQRVSNTYLTERDEALKKLAATDALYVAARARIVTLEAERNRAYDQAAQDIAERVRRAGAADAVAVLDRLLQTPLPGMSKAAAAGAAGVGGDGASAVQPADAGASAGVRGPSH